MQHCLKLDNRIVWNKKFLVLLDIKHELEFVQVFRLITRHSVSYYSQNC
jgi:hypothetical protein